MIEPYTFVRSVTVGLGAIWTTTGLLRTLRTAKDLRERLSPLSIDDRWWRRQITLVVLRATVLDPLNVALLCLLAWLCTRPL